MINPGLFFRYLREKKIDFFTGVPDSLLKHFCAYVTDNTTSDEHVIAANEGGALALAAGYHLATGKVPLVYLQNSGVGNIVNPAVSLTDSQVYSIPAVLIIGWRGCPGVKDQPQHIKQGCIQNDLLKVLDIDYQIIGPDTENIKEIVDKTVSASFEKSSPRAIVVKPGTFEKYSLKEPECCDFEMSREDAIKTVLNSLSSDDVVVSTTGKASREVYEYREREKEGHHRDFLTVGSMGHASQIALGISLKTSKNVVCLDGDGSVIMHMGSMAISGMMKRPNFMHIVLNNACHDSVGGQPTAASEIDLVRIASGCGYAEAARVETSAELKKKIKQYLKLKAPCFIEVVLRKGARKDLGRPDASPKENKKALMEFLKNTDEASA